MKANGRARFRLTHRPGVRPGDVEVITGKSMTVPGESVSLRDLVTRFAISGDIREGVSRDGQYPDEEPDLDDDDLEKLSRSDGADQAEYLEQARASVQELSSQVKKKAKAKGEAEPVTRSKEPELVEKPGASPGAKPESTSAPKE